MSRQIIPYGAAINPHKLDTDNAYGPAIIQYCQQIVPETGMKWRDIQNTRGVFDFGPADKIVDFAKLHGLAVRGHTLVWDCARKMPEWINNITDKDQAKHELIKRITTVVSRYKDVVHSWDVVNEPTDDCLDDQSKPIPSIWKKLLGLDYIPLAFKTARAADPTATLVLNEFGIEANTGAARLKRTALYNLIVQLRQMGVPIDSVGMQCHLAGDLKIDTNGLRKFVTDLHKMNVKVLITELDVKDYKLPDDINVRDEIVAQQVQTLLQAVAVPSAVLTWGITDRYTWLSSGDETYKRKDGRPLPLDRDYKPKPMMEVIQKFCRGDL